MPILTALDYFKTALPVNQLQFQVNFVSKAGVWFLNPLTWASLKPAYSLFLDQHPAWCETRRTRNDDSIQGDRWVFIEQLNTTQGTRQADSE